MMINALTLKIGRTSFSLVSSQRSTQLQFLKAKSSISGEEMDKKQPQDLPNIEKDRDSIASFGEGYATRSDEEGFGGIYCGNQSLLPKEDEDKVVHGRKVPEYDHSQGSEVKEKKRARNQEEVCKS